VNRLDGLQVPFVDFSNLDRPSVCGQDGRRDASEFV
jgi:hypothetical protein